MSKKNNRIRKILSCVKKFSLEKARRENETLKKNIELTRMLNNDSKKQNDLIKSFQASEEKLIRYEKELDEARYSSNEK
jgi:hypothetical protein